MPCQQRTMSVLLMRILTSDSTGRGGNCSCQNRPCFVDRTAHGAEVPIGFHTLAHVQLAISTSASTSQLRASATMDRTVMREEKVALGAEERAGSGRHRSIPFFSHSCNAAACSARAVQMPPRTAQQQAKSRKSSRTSGINERTKAFLHGMPASE